MAGSEYLFIDGEYLTRRFAEVLAMMFENDPTPSIDLPAVQKHFQAQKVFYYDCVDDAVRVGESREQADDRIQAQRARLGAIASLPGFHVREGTVTGSNPKKLRQKEVVSNLRWICSPMRLAGISRGQL